MASRNLGIVMGHVGHTPHLEYTRNQTGVARFSVATDWRVKHPDGQIETKTEWHNCIAFGKTAELICEYVQRGNLIYVEGPMHTRSYTGRDGTQKTICELHVEKVQFLRSQQGGDAAADRQA